MINQREELSKVVNDESGYYDETKLQRIELLYDFYVDNVLRLMQIIYY